MMQVSVTADYGSYGRRQGNVRQASVDPTGAEGVPVDPTGAETPSIDEDICHDEEPPMRVAETSCPNQPETPESVSTAAARLLRALIQSAMRACDRAQDIMTLIAPDGILLQYMVALLLGMLWVRLWQAVVQYMWAYDRQIHV